MKLILKTITAAALLAYGLSANASVCFDNVGGFTGDRKELPAMLQTGEFYAVANSWKATGGLHFFPNGKTFNNEVHINPVIGATMNEMDMVGQVCVNGNTVSTQLADGTGQNTITIVNSNTIQISGVDFNLVNKEAYQQAIASVPGADAPPQIVGEVPATLK